MHCIAFLGPTASAPTSTATTQLDVLRTALAEFGLVEGRNIVIDSQWPDVDRLDRLPESAAVLLALKPAVIIAIGATAARAASAATTAVPIVVEVVVDPLATGLTLVWSDLAETSPASQPLTPCTRAGSLRSCRR